MKNSYRCLQELLALGMATALPASAQVWNASSADFRVAANWLPAGVPSAGQVASINNAGTATLGPGPSIQLGALALGNDGTASADLVGNLAINGATLELAGSAGDSLDSFVGNSAANFGAIGLSSLVLNDATLLMDDPAGAVSAKVGFSSRFDFAGGGAEPEWATTGLNSKDLVIGSRSRGRLEMHGTSRILCGDDVGIANSSANPNGGQDAAVLMDGDSLLAVGSGIEVGKVTANVSIVLKDRAVMAAGNSMGPGNPAGQTDEGYFTVGTRATGVHSIWLQDDAELQCMTFQNRQGITTIQLTNNAKIKVHNVLKGSGPVVATVPTYFASGTGAGAATNVCTLRGNSLLLVDALVGNVASGGTNGVNGLHLAGGAGSLNSASPGGSVTAYNGDGGSLAVLDVRDSASLDIKQSLHVGFGNAPTAEGVLRVEGPGPRIHVGWDLNLAFNAYVDAIEPGSGPRQGTGRLHFVLTSDKAATVHVGGVARVGNGVLRVDLKDFVPQPGTAYSLVKAAAIDGTFKEVQLEGAPLPPGQAWKLDYSATEVRLSVSGPPVLAISNSGGNVTISWNGGGTLQSSQALGSAFIDIPGAVSPYTTTAGDAQRFFRVR